MSAIGKIGVRSGGPAGCLVPGCSGGSGSPGRSGSRFTQWVGMSPSLRRNFVVSSAMVRKLTGAGLVRPEQVFASPLPGNEFSGDADMTNLRYEAYRRVLAVLDELEAPELDIDEREVL